MTIGRNWTEDETGLWYRSPGNGNRTRGRWAICQICSARFPAQIQAPGKFCSKQCLGRAKGGSNRRGRSDLFLHWTAEECWLAGLLWADGHLSIEGAKRSVLFNITDEELAAHAARIIGCSYGTYDGASSDGSKRKPVHRLRFGARELVARFEAIGFDQPKLTTRSFPDLPHSAAFLRGLFDGDGCVIWLQQGGRRKTANTPFRLHSRLCGSAPCLDGVQAFLAGYGIQPKKIMHKGAIREVAWNHYDSLRLAEVMYADGGPCLTRKRETFLESSAPRIPPKVASC